MWLALGTLLMGLGTLSFLTDAYGVDDPEAKQFSAITTPLLLLDLALLVDADRETIPGLVGADALMIGTGLIGARGRRSA